MKEAYAYIDYCEYTGERYLKAGEAGGKVASDVCRREFQRLFLHGYKF